MQFGAFGRQFRCIAVDLRGHGLSDKPEGDYSVGLFASDVALLLTAIGAAPAHIVGLSLGGMVAQQLGIAHPHVVRSLALLNTLPGVWPPTKEMVAVGAASASGRARRPRWRRHAACVAASLFPSRDEQMLRHMAEQRLAGNDPAAYRRAMLAVATLPPRRALAQDRLPGADRCRRQRPCRAGRVPEPAARPASPHAQFVTVCGGGHACNIDYADEVNAAVLAFLETAGMSEPHETPEDLRPVIVINDRLAIPTSELEFRFSRSSGPGGQHVQRSDTRVELLFNVAASPSLTDEQRARIAARLGNQIDGEGVLRVVSSTTRSQLENREEAVSASRRCSPSALRQRKRRVATKPSAAAREARLTEKRVRSQHKAARRKVGRGDFE